MKALITYDENQEILSINRYPKIPNDWRRPNGNWVLGYANRTEWHYDDGWRDFTEPTFDPFNFKKTSNLIEVVDTPNYVTYEVVEMTQAEKDEYISNHEESEAGNHVNTRQSDGNEEARWVFRNLKKLHNKGTITTAQYRAAENILFDALLPMTYGLWEVTQTRLNEIPDPSNSILLNILNTVRDRVNNYLNGSS